MSQPSLSGPSWQGSLHDLANVIQHIRRSHAFGRLSLRNLEQTGVAHLYFRAGKLIHVVGHRGDARSILLDLRAWQRANVRFERGVASASVTVSDEHEQLLIDILAQLQRRGLVLPPPQVPAPPKVIDSSVALSSHVQQLLAPWEWRILVEAMRRVSLAVAHLVGPREALSVLQDILDDCSASFPAFASLQIAPTGYLHIADRSQLDTMSRQNLLDGFTALFSICQHFCAPIIGERDAHKLLVQSLQELAPALVNLGVFTVNNKLLFSNDVG